MGDPGPVIREGGGASDRPRIEGARERGSEGAREEARVRGRKRGSEGVKENRTRNRFVPVPPSV